MQVRGMTWLGVRTPQLDETAAFFSTRLGMQQKAKDPAKVVFSLPNGDTIEVFSADDPEHAHFTTGPVAGFLVDDVAAARQELQDAGVELLGTVMRDGGLEWAHFRGPDGHVYELTARTEET